MGKESLIYGLSTVLARLLNFVLMPFYTHYLLPSEYGIIAAVFSYIAFFNIIYGYGLNQGYMRYYRREKSLASSFAAVFYTSLLLSILIAFFSPSLAKLSGIGEYNNKLIIYASIILALDAFTLIPFADLRIYHKAKRFVFVRTVSIVINVILNIIFLAYLRMGVEGVFWANIISSAVSVFLLGSYFKYLFEKIDFKLLKEISSYSLPFLPAGLSIMVVQVIDRPILLKLADPSSAGIYQANYRLAIIMSMLVTMFDQAWRPFVIERSENPSSSSLFSKVFTYFTFLSLSVWLFFSLFMEDIVSFEIYGKPIVAYAYHSGLFIVPIIMGAYFFNGIYINFLAPVIISKKTKPVMFAAIAGAAANLALNFAFIPSYGIKAAAWSALISYLLMTFSLRFLTRKDYEINYDYMKFFAMIFIALLSYFIYLYFYQKAASCSLPALKALLIVLYPPLCYAAGCFSKEEIKSFSSFLRDRFSRKY